MGCNPYANGGLLLKELLLPEFRSYAVKVERPGNSTEEGTRVLGRFLRDIFKLNQENANFRLMGPDETESNRLSAVFEVTDRVSTAKILPKDVQVVPFYDRSELVQLTIDTVEANLLRGMVLVLIVLIFFLVSLRAAVIVALTIPLALLFSFVILHARGVSANLLSIGAIDFGIIIDGTVVMMENIYRELADRAGQEYKLHEVIAAAARDVDRPIFYSVAVILAGYLPIYALTGPSGKL